MITCKQITPKQVEKTKNKLLIEKMEERSNAAAEVMNLFVSDYYRELSKKFDNVIIRHMERAKNGFKDLPLEEKLRRINKIKPTIDRLARINNPDHPHIGVAKELIENTFYRIMDVYAQILKKEGSYI